MVKVFVIGGGGYIGLEVSKELARAGHDVTALVRSAPSAKALALQGVATVIGDVAKPETYSAAFLAASTIVDCYGGEGGDAKHFDVMRDLLRKAHAAGYYKRFLGTGGCADYGDCPGQIIDESYPLNGTGTQARIKWAKELLAATEYGGSFILPGYVYGTNFGRYFSPWFSGDATGRIVIDGKLDKCSPFVHIFDLAAAYRTIVELPDAQFAHQSYNVADGVTRLTYQELRLLCAMIAGLNTSAGNVVYVKEPSWGPGDVSNLASCEKLRRVGWEPRFGNMVDHLELAYKLWVASKS